MLVRIEDSPRGRARAALVCGVLLLGIFGVLAYLGDSFLALFGSGSIAVTSCVWGVVVLRTFPPDRHEDGRELRRLAAIALVVGVVVALVPALALGD
ncbi:MAG: hypothetical protein Q8O67_20930 [Deltaproteobacteria bacterium]|nr:hypothetical protein [Deltaproteobacteria bacterium]